MKGIEPHCGVCRTYAQGASSHIKRMQNMRITLINDTTFDCGTTNEIVAKEFGMIPTAKLPTVTRSQRIASHHDYNRVDVLLKRYVPTDALKNSR